jgi:adenylate cyclase
MGVEIERKFLVIDDSFLQSGQITRIRRLTQGYPKIAGCALRFQYVQWLQPERAQEGRITIKSAKAEQRRLEFEYSIPAEDALAMLEHFCSTRRVRKIRVDVLVEKDTWEIDVYENELTGLMLCELEFHADDPELLHTKPTWAGKEVTDKPAYYNQNLAKDGWPADYTTLISSWDHQLKLAQSCWARLKEWKGVEA